jgi:hypothetical protein
MEQRTVDSTNARPAASGGVAVVPSGAGGPVLRRDAQQRRFVSDLAAVPLLTPCGIPGDSCACPLLGGEADSREAAS